MPAEVAQRSCSTQKPQGDSPEVCKYRVLAERLHTSAKHAFFLSMLFTLNRDTLQLSMLLAHLFLQGRASISQPQPLRPFSHLTFLEDALR